MKRSSFLILMSFLSIWAQAPQTYSVCDLFGTRVSVGSGLVSVKGLIDGSPFHGYVLKERADQGSCADSRAELQSAPGAIVLAWDGGYGVTLSDADIRANRAVLADLLARYKRRDVAPRPFVVTGKIIFKESPAITRMRDGSFTGNGFGEMGAYAAMIVVKSAAPQ